MTSGRRLSNGGNGRNSGLRNARGSRQVNVVGDLAVGVLLGAIAGDVAGLAALVAGLASSVKRATVGSGAVTRDVAKLTASIALHGLSLAVSCEVVGPTALVAGSRTWATGEGATAVATVSATGNRGTTSAHVDAGGVGACALLKH